MYEMNKEELWGILEQEECLLADGFDDAVIGISYGPDQVAIYDIGKVVEILSEDMPHEDAVEFFEYNIAGTYLGPKTPMFVFTHGK